jgi:hypothetical protein
MPLIPRGLSPGLFERLKDRFKRELTERVVSPVRERVERGLGVEPPEEEPPPTPHRPPTTNAEKMFRIQQAGQQGVLLWMRYNGQYRNVEPYSYRYRDADYPSEPLFFGWCFKDKKIEAFKIRKIQDIQVTDTPFAPRWTVEF